MSPHIVCEVCVLSHILVSASTFQEVQVNAQAGVQADERINVRVLLIFIGITLGDFP